MQLTVEYKGCINGTQYNAGSTQMHSFGYINCLTISNNLFNKCYKFVNKMKSMKVSKITSVDKFFVFYVNNKHNLFIYHVYNIYMPYK